MRIEGPEGSLVSPQAPSGLDGTSQAVKKGETPMLMKISMVLAFVLALAWGQSLAADLKPGDVAPEFSLPGSDGKTYSLKQFKGKQVVVLAWFPKAFTGG